MRLTLYSDADLLLEFPEFLKLTQPIDARGEAGGSAEYWQRMVDWQFRQPGLELKESEMNWDIVEGNWKQFNGKVKAQWGKLTDDQLDVISGKRIELAGKIQEAYGISKDEAEKQIKAFEEANKDYRP